MNFAIRCFQLLVAASSGGAVFGPIYFKIRTVIYTNIITGTAVTSCVIASGEVKSAEKIIIAR